MIKLMPDTKREDRWFAVLLAVLIFGAIIFILKSNKAGGGCHKAKDEIPVTHTQTNSP